jgi:hypothetical protein
MPWSNRAPAMHLSSIKREKMRRQPRKGTLEEASFGRLAAITVEGRTLRIAWDVGAEKKSALQQKNGNKWKAWNGESEPERTQEHAEVVASDVDIEREFTGLIDEVLKGGNVEQIESLEEHSQGAKQQKELGIFQQELRLKRLREKLQKARNSSASVDMNTTDPAIETKNVITSGLFVAKDDKLKAPAVFSKLESGGPSVSSTPAAEPPPPCQNLNTLLMILGCEIE